jgi:hypothetical protein
VQVLDMIFSKIFDNILQDHHPSAAGDGKWPTSAVGFYDDIILIKCTHEKLLKALPYVGHKWQGFVFF